MDKLERLYALHSFFDGRRTALPLSEIVERLECSPATAKRAIRELRTLLDAPLVYDVDHGGYRYAPADGEPRFELPGLWFRAEELAALVTLREVLAQLAPGLLGEILAPLARRLDEILARRSLGLSMRWMVPSASPYSVGVPERFSFAAEYPARTYPCQRFDAPLAGSSA